MPEITVSQYENMMDWYKGFHLRIATQPHLASLRKQYPASPDQHPELNYYREMHVQAMLVLRSRLDHSTVDSMVAAIDEFIRHDLGVPSAQLIDEPDVKAAAENLAQRGRTGLPPVNSQAVLEMRHYFLARAVYPGSYVEGPERCIVDEARGGNFASYTQQDVFVCPHLTALANNPHTLAIVERYLGTTPMILGYSAWWSFAQSEEAVESQLFHLDCDDYRFVKMFIYLTDVGPDDGPHTYMDCSHDPAYLRGLRKQWPGGPEDFDKLMFGTLRKSDEEIAQIFHKAPTRITGRAGSQFLIDTKGAHKGVPPLKSDRLICQVLYGVSPQVQGKFLSLRLGDPDTGHIPEWVMQPPGDYINRLYLERA